MYCSRCGTQNEDSSKFCRSCGLDLTATTPIGAVKTGQQELTEIDMVREQLKEEYEILDELGRGGMAIVFKAREKQLERDVAIKVLPFSLAFDKEFVERFQREARTSAKLEHPGIIPIYRVGKHGRVIYFVMKFLRGKPLSAVLAARGPLPPVEIRRVLIEVGRALAYAHRSGIVHRDIKPDNIMFDEHGQAVVTDFGIAKAATGGKLTGTGMAIGTPHYMSPEQARAQALDGRSDIYSLGVVAYQCLVGSVPFDGEDSFSIGYKHIMEELPTPPLESVEKRDLFEIVKKMMAKLPDERFQNADDLVQVLEAGAPFVATGISTAATRAIPGMSGARLASAPTTPLPRATGTRPGAWPGATAPAPPHRSVGAALLILFVVVGGVLGGGGFLAYKEGWLPKAWGLSAKPDSTAARDSAADSTRAADSTADSASAPSTPGKIVLSGFPDRTTVTIDGQVAVSPAAVQPGSHRIEARATGYSSFYQTVDVAPGATVQVPVHMVNVCAEPGPAYNQDNFCFDSRPAPLADTHVPWAANDTIVPRLAILWIHVSSDGRTLETRTVVPSNVETFTEAAKQLALQLHWNPAQKNGQPVDAWTQAQFPPKNQ
ncbi:MAG TPA: protein kinase [Gemmatimonadales bacterium]|nr:protein kinase [Gemmatimonadales bacterium]